MLVGDISVRGGSTFLQREFLEQFLRFFEIHRHVFRPEESSPQRLRDMCLTFVPLVGPLIYGGTSVFDYKVAVACLRQDVERARALWPSLVPDLTGDVDIVEYIDRVIAAIRAEISSRRSVFIGHGQSPAWELLKEFLAVDLGLPYEEFSRQSPAGYTTQQRLFEMLDRTSFAFIVMTAEDERKDGGIQARANVIHEAGLFQAGLGFSRAIILLEDGCEPFSNIAGLTHIGFPKSSIRFCFGEVQRVLIREGLLEMVLNNG